MSIVSKKPSNFFMDSITASGTPFFVIAMVSFGMRKGDVGSKAF